MRQKTLNWLLLLLTISILTGCASTTQSFIPNEIQAIPEGYARIVVTRQSQLAGKYTPVYILDIGDELDSNGEIAVRIGEWRKEAGLSLWYMPDMLSSFSRGGFFLMPSSNFKFSESGLSLDDLFEQNLNAVIYVDYLNCNLNELNTLSCSDGKNDCDSEFRQELRENDGVILNTLVEGQGRNSTRSVQVSGKILGGETLIWDRKPGLMRIGALWGAFIKTENIVEITPGNIIVEPGKTYYLKYELSLTDKTWRGDRWTITRVE